MSRTRWSTSEMQPSGALGEFEKCRRGCTDQDFRVAAVFGERVKIVPRLGQGEAIQPITNETSCEDKAEWNVQTTENDTWGTLGLSFAVQLSTYLGNETRSKG